MRIRDVVYAVGRSGYVNKDLVAVKQGAKQNGMVYEGKPATPGYRRIVQPGAIISVMLVLENGAVAIGECADVIFSGLAGRDPLFDPAEHLPVLESTVREWLIGRTVDQFRANANELDQMQVNGDRLHTALRYGLTQALLSATALGRNLTIAEVIRDEYDCAIRTEPTDLLASCHRGDTQQLDRMILKRAAILPHASFTTAADLGPGGQVLVDYARTISTRIREIGEADYRPRIHLDVYGTLGDLFGDDVDTLVTFLGRVAEAAQPFEVLIETPVIATSRAAQMDIFTRMRAGLKARDIKVGLIADEWCNTLEDIREFADAHASDFVQIKTPDLGGVNNTIEAVLYCKRHGMGCCLGGTANETDLSARICAQIGLATSPDFMMTKPGLGADEGYMILTNEMLRTIALIESHRA
ncbi:methylaspartate ammonia-lyase [Paraburkholderia humisilvae]|uniref:methylaspartate ammonia-lyase n=1 Tax=Paraburkholderia humisilvae TaxID=627669 RepID=A0A6J5F4D8_9BURK|nr:methylaspartate ammonia-lyase [Paraburkholderia humisilvae]CAB3773709.1 Methylaspartate ammonia-lyase 1 [Paraburkholderia humisilvae]